MRVAFMPTRIPRIVLFVLLALAIFWSVPSTDAKRTLRVMTYNIHVGVGMDKKLDLQRIADVINAARPDLVGLQEVDRGVQRTDEASAHQTEVDHSMLRPPAENEGGAGVTVNPHDSAASFRLT